MSGMSCRPKHAGIVVWLTGLSGAGKTTLSGALSASLTAQGFAIFLLDGDALRGGLNSDLGFSPEDRHENIRRAGEVAALIADAGFICIAGFISPYRNDREKARIAARSRFIEVYLSTDIGVCEARDPKGLYAKARAGVISEFTGVSSPYEVPLGCEVVLDTGVQSLEACVEIVERTIFRFLDGDMTESYQQSIAV